MVTVKTNKGDLKVIMTTGPWGPAMAKKLGIELPFKVSNVWNIQELWYAFEAATS